MFKVLYLFLLYVDFSYVIEDVNSEAAICHVQNQDKEGLSKSLYASQLRTTF